MFGMAKLKWVNGQHIRLRSADELKPLLVPVLSAGLLDGKVPSDAFATLAVANTQDKVELMEDAVPIICKVLSFPLAETLTSDEAKEIVDDDFGSLAAALVTAFDSGEMPSLADPEFGEKWAAFVKGLGKTLKRKGGTFSCPFWSLISINSHQPVSTGKRLFHPIRVALTGSMSGPEVGLQLQLLAASEGLVAEHMRVSFGNRIDALRAFSK
jgi:glutamyl-tRNA synthetase